MGDQDHLSGEMDSRLGASGLGVSGCDRCGARLTTVLDDDYPLNLRLIHNQPPFLLFRGGLDADRDAQSVAVVGTRSATPDGVRQTRRCAASQTREDGAVVSESWFHRM